MTTAPDVRETLLPAAPNAPMEARRVLARVSALGGDLGYRALLMVSEVVTNCVVHAQLHEASTIRLRTIATSDLVRVEVIDHGPGFAVEEALHEREAPETGGFGLRILSRLADRWGVEHNGATTVWFELDRR